MRTKPDSRSEERGTIGGRARRAQIERAAAEVLAEAGYAGTSVARIAERAGVSKGVITYHFATKNEIFQRVTVNLVKGCAEHVAESASLRLPPADRLRQAFKAELEFFSSRRIEFLAMAEVLANHRDEDFARTFDDVSTDETTALMNLLAEGQAQGQFRAFPVEDFAHLISSVKNATLDRWANDETLDLASMLETMLDFLENAVSAR